MESGRCCDREGPCQLADASDEKKEPLMGKTAEALKRIWKGMLTLARLPRKRKKTRIWSIGIYHGNSPYDFAPLEGAPNPVLTRENVSDVPADFIADPFMVRDQSGWFMFFEVMNRQTRKGEIGLAVSQDAVNWNYQHIVLAEPFHLSYPYVFEWSGEYYMIPETQGIASIQLYRAERFPDHWSFVGTLLRGRPFIDSSIVRYGGKWWIFTETNPDGKHDTLRLYYADHLMGPWTEHPDSPVIQGNPRIARPAGRLIVLDNCIVRYAQNCYPRYGTHIHAFEITELTPTTYRERAIGRQPVLAGSGRGWNQSGMHHIDPHPLNERHWVACVDGWFKG